MRPLNCLRNFVFLGCSMAASQQLFGLRRFALALAAPTRAASFFVQTLVLRHRIVLKDLAFEDPNLNAARAVGRERRRGTVINVGTQRMQRHAAFAIPLQASDFGSAQTPRAVDADALGAEPHGGLHRPLHGASERDTT